MKRVLAFIFVFLLAGCGGTNENKNLVAENGDQLRVKYTGKLENGKVFDENWNDGFVFELGAGQVIAGWDKGVLGMKVGEKRELAIEPADGYGKRGVPGVIPPNAKLFFEVELAEILPQK